MDIARRDLLRGGAAGLAAAALPLVAAQAKPEGLGTGDVTAELQREIDAAARRGRPFLMPAATMHVARLRLHDGARLIGVRGESRLVLAGDGPLIIAENVSRVTLTGIVFDGDDRVLDKDRGLVDCTGVGDFLVSDCAFHKAAGIGLRLDRCGGWIERNHVRDVAAGGIFSLDSLGLTISDNVVERCSDNGIQLWRSVQGDDGSRISGNRIFDIHAASGGSGQYGNGISIFRAGGVNVSANLIRRCAFSAVRNNGGRNVIVTNNNCADLGETAIFAEFGFEGCVIAGNIVDGARSGIQMVNFADAKGRAAVCSANIIRNLRPTQDHSGHEFGYEAGIKVEADAAVTGNLVEGAPWVGILAGWGPSLRDVAITGNVVRDTPVGIGVSVAEGAGTAVITGNTISGAARGAVVGMAWDKLSTADLARGAAAPGTLSVSGNHAM